nr:immunoglobulin light chain junction region [Macaca mulatta]
CGQATKWPFTF